MKTSAWPARQKPGWHIGLSRRAKSRVHVASFGYPVVSAVRTFNRPEVKWCARRTLRLFLCAPFETILRRLNRLGPSDMVALQPVETELTGGVERILRFDMQRKSLDVEPPRGRQ